MIDAIMSALDYWVMWHFSLAILAYLIFYRLTFHKQKAMLWTFGLAVGWEILEYFIGLENYSGVKAFLRNSLIDWGTVLIAVFVVVVIIRNVRLIYLEE